MSVRIFSFLFWQPPTLPYRLQYSTLGRPSLHLRVRDDNIETERTKMRIYLSEDIDIRGLCENKAKK
mgnify:CR=1 FL=1